MIQKVTKNMPIGELFVFANDKKYLVKVFKGGTYGHYKEMKHRYLIAMVTDGVDITSQILPLYTDGEPYTFDITLDGIEFNIVCNGEMTVTVNGK